MNTFEGLRKILVRDYQQVATQLSPETPFADLAIDSLGVIELIFAIEDEFKVIAADADPEIAKQFATLQDITDYIDRLTAQRDTAETASRSINQPAELPST